MKLETLIKNDSSIFLDTNCFIYLLEGVPEYEHLAISLFNVLALKSISLVTSSITLSEILVHVYRTQKTHLVDFYQDVLRDITQNQVLSPSVSTAGLAARIRAQYNFSLIDSYQLAIAQESKCHFFITNDRQLKQFAELQVVLLSELEV